MKRILRIIVIVFILTGCMSNSQLLPQATVTAQITETFSSSQESVWNVYDPNPDHIWNRVFRQFYKRSAPDGKEYGLSELDPLLWFDTTYLLDDTSHQQALQVLDEFLNTHAERLIEDRLKRAMFQRDLWAVFDWLASQADPYPSQRRALEMRIAKIIRRVALTDDQIVALPNNYAMAVESRAFPAYFQTGDPQAAFLPSDLFQPDGAWVPVGRAGGPVAMAHTEGFPFFGRSVFLVFIRSPEGQTATLDFIRSLNIEAHPVFSVGFDVALVRQMLLIDEEGNLVLSPIVETIQIRHFSPEQFFHEFELDRRQLLNGDANSFVVKTDLFMLFAGHGDIFEGDHGSGLKAPIPDICKGCHLNIPRVMDSGDMQSLLQSIISYSRVNFPLPGQQKPALFATTREDEAQTVIQWKVHHPTWQILISFSAQ